LDLQTAARESKSRSKAKNTILVADEFEEMMTEDIFGLGAKGRFTAILKESAKEQWKEKLREPIESIEESKQVLKFD